MSVQKVLRQICAALILVCVSISTILVLVPVSATAATNVFEGVCATNQDAANNPESSTVCKDQATPTVNPLTGSNGIIIKVSTIIASLAGFVAVVMVVIAGAQMINSGGDPNKVSAARSKLSHALIGVAIIALAQVIVVLFINSILK